MSDTPAAVRLLGRLFVGFEIRALSGLSIGGSDVGVEIGGVDRTVIRDPLSNQPYIPGSSLRGKMRSLTEKHEGAPQNQRIGQATIHTCQNAAAYAGCCICQVYGVPGERDFSTPTRLLVRDVPLSEASVQQLQAAQTDFPFTQIKTEVAIDRVTSVASPRQIERVPAGAVFGPAELVYSVYAGAGGACDPARDIENMRLLLLGLTLLEDDYLGGLGSRGSGRVRVQRITVGLKDAAAYGTVPEALIAEPLADLAALEEAFPTLQETVRERLLRSA